LLFSVVLHPRIRGRAAISDAKLSFLPWLTSPASSSPHNLWRQLRLPEIAVRLFF
jgi:hypothetical protein